MKPTFILLSKVGLGGAGGLIGLIIIVIVCFYLWIKPKSVIRPTYISFSRFFRSLYAISAFLSASCPHPCLAVARYAFDSGMDNLLETNTNLA